MIWKDKIIYYWLIINQYFTNSLNLLKIHILGVENIKIMHQNKVKNILFQFILYNFFNKLVNFFEFIKNILLKLKCQFDIDSDNIHVTKLSKSGTRSIIINQTGHGEKRNFEQLNSLLKDLEINDSMIKTTFINFELINTKE